MQGKFGRHAQILFQDKSIRTYETYNMLTLNEKYSLIYIIYINIVLTWNPVIKITKTQFSSQSDE